MKRYFKSLLIFSLVSVEGLLHAQATNTENYIQTRTYLEGVTTSNTTARQIQSVQYFDGLGRPKQVVNVKASPLGRDVVTHIEYDGFGRQVKDYLPVPQSSTLSGAIVPTPLANATQTGIYGTEKIYAEKTLENSPLDRILEQKQVGTAWSTKPVKFQYDANIQADYVRKYETTTTWDSAGKMTVSTIQLLQYFLPNSLYKNTITDEDGNKTIEFKNGQGQIVLVRKVLSATENADTYYVYNEYNQLAFVVPPASPATLDDTALNNFCYQYRYDGRNRLVEKKLPGKGWEYMVYDKQDRLIMTQDANMKVSGNWLFTKYDKFSRVVYTGIANIGAQFNRGQVQFSADYYIDQGQPSSEERNTTGFTNSGMTVYYSNAVYPTTVAKVLSINYYDTYPTGTPTMPTQVLGQNVLPQNAQSSNVSTKSLPVASYVKNIEDDNWTKTYTWYDLRGRVIGTHSVNHLGGYTKTETELDFAGVPQKVNTYHKRLVADTEKITKEVFTYDHQNRLLTHTHQVGSGSVEYLAQNKYNELSQLESKKVGGTSAATPLQTVDYKYNIRGWMTKINDPANLGGKLFGYEIKYTNPVFSGTAPGKFNGNIAEIDWKSSMDGILRRYDYQYDALNRLGKGTYSEPGSSLIYNNYFNEELTYDLNGNILTLKRLSKPSSGTVAESIDDLVYNYYNGQSNRLQKITLPSGVTNNSSGYNALGNTIGYDDNGNMTDQLDKGITKIIYNYLNLPNSIKKSTETINYTYRADGVKVGKNSSGIVTQTDYLDGFQYETTTGTAVLKFIPTSEGYYNFENNKYIYNYTDHLGNVRLSYTRNDTGTEIIEENNYYPFGLKHERYNNLAGNPSYQYKYNGKELQTESGMYDYGARMYMPDIGRWGVVDPLAEKMTRYSPYNYAFNNPLRFIDPDGRQGEDFVQRKDGSIYWDNKANDQATTKAGETYLGKELTFKFNSYIDGNLWDVPSYVSLGLDASGDKLTSTLILTGRENSAGELTSLVGSFSSEPGPTPIGKPRMFYPGEGGNNNTFSINRTSTGANVNFEQHGSVSKFEESGLNAMGFRIVDVAQKLNINYNSSNGNLSVDAYTNVFPSANLTVSGNGNTSKLMQYNQPSFIKTHTAPTINNAAMGIGGVERSVRDFSYYPSKFYKRN